MDLAGRGVILTGASGGIGEPLFAALTDAGAHVLAVGRNEVRLRELAQYVPAGALHRVVADVATTEGRARVLQAAHAMRPLPSVLVLGHAQSAFGLFQ